MLALGVIVGLAGLAVLVVEAHVSTAGVLGMAGVMAVAAGVGLVLVGSGAELVVALPVAVGFAAVGMVAVAIVARAVVAARHQSVRTGPERLIGVTATVRTWSAGEGQVVSAGTLWRARVSWGWEDPPPAPGETVVVNELDGLTLSIRRPDPWEVEPAWTPSSLSS